MRLTGAPVDESMARRHEEDLVSRLARHEAAIYRAAGRQFNINSVPQKQEILYAAKKEAGQGLKPWKLTPAGEKKKKAGKPLYLSDYSTDDSVMQSYPGNAVVDALRDYGDVDKLLNTYVRAYLGTADKPGHIHDGRLHTWFKAYGARTGRLSSSAPNLQNVPAPGTPDGRLLRSMFVAPPGWKMIVADWSQVELVVIAHYIGHGGLYDAFMNGLDPHRNTAAGMFTCAPDQVTAHQRQLAKVSNFLISYGGGWNTLMISANKYLPPEDKISAQTARDVMARYASTYPEVEDYRAAVMDFARSRKPPYLRTLVGRKRHLQALNSPVPGIRATAERAAFSALIQGSAADLNKIALIRTDNMLGEQLPEAYVTLDIHDEIVVLAPDDQAEKARDIVTEAMIGPEMQVLLRVPLKVEAKVVDNWAAAK
jgi:DNA polymerase I-like protein with 3'-5' exonuclease and polymerase domains